MRILCLSFLILCLTNTLFAQSSKTVLDSAQTISANLKRVADWQLKQQLQHPLYDWTNGALYAGIMAYGKIANNEIYYNRMRQYGNLMAWKEGPNTFFADDYCVGQLFCEMYNIYGESQMIERLKKLGDTIVSLPHTESLEMKNDIVRREWAWCDALFMGPATLCKLYQVTGDTKYLDGMNKLWWKTTDYLFDKEEKLYFRDSRYFFDRDKEKNGKKKFWSRGNGWVLGGLARILEIIPKDYPDYPRYVQLFKDMCEKVASIQQPDGTWHASLLDPTSYSNKETSGTGFFAYALTWGINQGFLDKTKFTPVILKAWTALTTSIHPNGKLGFVQKIGDKPENVKFEDTEVYGVGAFLLAGTELLKYAYNEQKNAVKITVQNTQGFQRNDVNEFDYQDLINKLIAANTPVLNPKQKKKSKIPAFTLTPNQIVIEDFATGKQVPYQIVYDDAKKPIKLLVLTELSAGTTQFLVVKVGTPETFTPRTFARLAPERYNDFAWESDRATFRMYEKALQKKDGPSNGIDIWVKHKHDLIIDYMFARDSKTDLYHIDKGRSLDCYKVGRTLGGGGIAPVVNGKLSLAENFTSYKINYVGVIRSQFELNYDAWDVNGKKISETKRVTIDAGSNLSKFEIIYHGTTDTIPAAVGIVKHKPSGKMFLDENYNVTSYWDEGDKVYAYENNGYVGVGTVVPQKINGMAVTEGHLLTYVKTIGEKPFTYYTGAGWSKGDFSTMDSWNTYLINFKKKLDTPLVISVK